MPRGTENEKNKKTKRDQLAGKYEAACTSKWRRADPKDEKRRWRETEEVEDEIVVNRDEGPIGTGIIRDRQGGQSGFF